MTAQVQTVSGTDCASSMDGGAEPEDDGCSLWKILNVCRSRGKRVGSKASLIKSDLQSSTSSVAASKRTPTTSQHDALCAAASARQSADGGAATAADPAAFDPDLDAVARSPSYLQVSRCVGGYSTFTSYAADRLQHQQAGVEAGAERWAEPRPNAVPRGGQQCRVTLVGDVISDVRPVSNGPSSSSGGMMTANGDVECRHHCSTAVPSCCTDPAQHAPIHGNCAPSTVKDGAYFLHVMESERHRLEQLCRCTERYLIDSSSAVPEEVQGKIRAAIGKANLLTTKKFAQFQQLCNENLNQSVDEPFETRNADLAGFWDLVQLQVADVDRQFSELDDLRRRNWIAASSPSLQRRAANDARDHVDGTSRSSGVKVRTTTPRSGRPSQTTSPAVAAKSSRSELAARSRLEARQRLMAAKQAGRQRKASDSDNDVEIFVS